MERVDIAPGQIALKIGAHLVAKSLGIEPSQIDPSALSITVPFRSRKRGVETKLILNGSARPVDQVLLANMRAAPPLTSTAPTGRG